MTEMAALVEAFLQWWVDPRSVPGFTGRFVPGFTYRMEPSGVEGEDAVWLIEQQLPWVDVRVESRSVEGDTAVLVLEATDPVTDLRRRMTLKVVAQDGCIVAVTQRSEEAI